MEREKAELNLKIFETERIAGGLIVIESVVVGSQMAVYSLSSERRYLAAGCWGR